MLPPTDVSDTLEPVICTKLVLVVFVVEIDTMLNGRLFSHSKLSRKWAFKSLAMSNSPTFQFLGVVHVAGTF
jgi:hypothetical protein